MSVNTNVAAMNAYRNLSTTNNAMGKSLERLSSGYRINKAADDAAGLAISEGLRSQIGGMTQAVRNTQDGTSVVQTAEGALSTTTSILQRMRDLSVQASSSGSLNDDAKASIQKEMTQLKSELSRISDTTTFNGTKLLDGNYKGTFQVGANAGETISVNIGKAMSAAGLGVDGVDVTGVGKYTASAGAAAGKVSTTNATSAASASLLITADSGTAANFAASAASFEDLTGQISFGGKTLDLSSVDYSGAAAGGADGITNATEALAALNKAAKAAFGVTTDPFALSGNNLTFGIKDAVTGYTGANGVALNAAGGASTAAEVAAATATFSGATGASDGIKKIDAAIKAVSAQRADLGAIQNRFEHTVNNLNVAIENTTASESRIRDTDMAAEMTAFTRAQVLTQAGTSMLAQANQSTQSILKLLG
ncbi:flagellin N-terminal helical domain-containing protein [Geodermatophilus sp. URMC 64]